MEERFHGTRPRNTQKPRSPEAEAAAAFGRAGLIIYLCGVITGVLLMIGLGRM